MKRTPTAVFALAALACLGMASEASARGFREAQIPNSGGCITCHTSASGGDRNPFGEDVEENLEGTPIDTADVAWSTICELDSDGDGETNGAELGDPCCAWTEGADEALDVTSAPGDADSTSGNRCENGTAVPGEEEPSGGIGGGCFGGEGGTQVQVSLLAGAFLLRRRRLARRLR